MTVYQILIYKTRHDFHHFLTALNIYLNTYLNTESDETRSGLNCKLPRQCQGTVRMSH